MRTAVLGALYALLIVLLAPFILFCFLTGLRDPLVRVGRWAVRLGQGVLGLEVEVEGLERLPIGRPVVFMANHLSFLDGPLLEMIIPGVPRAIFKKSLLRIPIIGPGMRHVGFVPVDRKRAEGGKRSIAQAATLMRERGYSFLIFPEGTRSRDGRLQPFRRGGFFLALAAGAPIVPVTILGTYELMPKGQWYARKGRVKVVFHPPVAIEGFSAETMTGLMEKVRGAIASSIGPDGKSQGETS